MRVLIIRASWLLAYGALEDLAWIVTSTYKSTYCNTFWRGLKVHSMSTIITFGCIQIYPHPPIAGFNHVWGGETRLLCEGRDPYTPVHQAVQSWTAKYSIECRFACTRLKNWQRVLHSLTVRPIVFVGALYKYVKIQGEFWGPYITVHVVPRHWNSKPEYDWDFQFPTRIVDVYQYQRSTWWHSRRLQGAGLHVIS